MFYHYPAFNALHISGLFLTIYMYIYIVAISLSLSLHLFTQLVSHQRLKYIYINLNKQTLKKMHMIMIFHYLLLCFSLHAWSAARPLHQVQEIGGSLQFSSPGKETRPVLMDEYSRVKAQGENTMKEKISEEIDGGRNEKINKGKNVALLPATRVVHDMIKIEEKGRQVRILESEEDNAEESIGGEENDDMGGEDVEVMDYAQPHRKPPIHNNKKP